MKEHMRTVALSSLMESPDNPRKAYGDLTDMAATIRTQGVIEPIVVRPREDGELEIVAGHRRARAAKLAGLKQVDVVVRKLSRAEALEVALVENTERASLNALETAEGYQRLVTKFGLSGDEAAKRVGVKRAMFYATKSLTELPEFTKKALIAGKLSATVAAELVRVRDSERVQQRALEDVLKLAKNGELPPIRAVRRLIQTRYLSTAKRGVSKTQREAKAHGVDTVLRRRAMDLLLLRAGELIECSPQLSETHLRLAISGHVESGSDEPREIFTSRGFKASHLSAIGASQLRSLVVQLAAVQAMKLDADGEYPPFVKVFARAFGLGLSEIEKTVAATSAAEALFSKE